MRRFIIACLLLALTGGASAQTEDQPAPTPAPPQQTQPTQPGQPGQPSMPESPEDATIPQVGNTLSWMVGNWSGEGVQGGQAFNTSMSVQPVLDGEALLVRRNSSSGFKELMILGYGKGSDKVIASLYDSLNHTGLFTAEASAQQIVLDQVTGASGYQSRRTFRLMGDGTVQFVVESAAPGESLSKRLEATLKKQ